MGGFCESADWICVLQEGNNWPGDWGRQGDPVQAYSVQAACATHTNWMPLLGLKVMKLPLS